MIEKYKSQIEKLTIEQQKILSMLFVNQLISYLAKTKIIAFTKFNLSKHNEIISASIETIWAGTDVKEEKHAVLSKQLELICDIWNGMQNLDVTQLCQIAGTVIKWENQTLKIDKEGRLDEWPLGFFDTCENLLHELL